jgi:uncharacterized protein with ParB-like and HNH nuclease domain
MQSLNQSVKHVLGAGSAYSIPPYQRQYQWSEELWQSLIHDVLTIGTAPDSEPPHWLGILLLTSDDTVRFPDDDSLSNYSVIDGQQRLVTLVIWLSALYHHAMDTNQKINFDLGKIAKVTAQKVDQIPLKIVQENLWLDKSYEKFAMSKVVQAYHYFRFILWLGEDALLEVQPIKVPKFEIPSDGISVEETWFKYLDSKKAEGLKRSKHVEVQELIEATRNRLMVFTLIHEPRIDEPQAVIFDTLNGNRTPLEPLDHVRNSIFVRLEPEVATSLFDNYWEPAENILRDLRLARQNPGVNFLYDYVISKGEKKRQGTINKTRGAIHFTKMTKNLKGLELADFLKEDVVVAMSTWPVIVRQRDSVVMHGIDTALDSTVLESISTIRELSAGPANPLVLHYVTERVKGKISDKDLLSRLALVESYLVRLILSNEPLSPLRSKMMEICSYLETRTDEITLREALKKHGWIDDKILEKDFEKRAMYEEAGPTALGAIFRGIEMQMSGSGANKFKVAKDQYTIEHIYPRKSGKWENDLSNWRTDVKKMDNFLDTFGNLTVVTQEHNSKVGNKPLTDKQKFPTIIGSSAPLRLHDDWVTAKQWTEKEIQTRSNNLLHFALKRWPDLQ